MSGKADFLDTIIRRKRERLAVAVAGRPLEAVREAAFAARSSAPPRALSAALRVAGRINVIAEIKRASPSKGDIRRGVDPSALAREYAAGGAAAISVLTEEDFFKGALEDLKAVRAAVQLPVLRKDFVVEEWQVYETADAGADALLLIVAALEDEKLEKLRRLTEEELGMDALVEVHDTAEMRRAEACGAMLVGVNNRSLRTFEVSLDVSSEVIRHAPARALLVSESGLRTPGDLSRLHALGYHGFLIGETLMRALNPREALRELLLSSGSQTA